MSKYKLGVLKLVTKTEIKSTHQVLKELEKQESKIINWYLVYRILFGLEEEGKIERLKSKAGIFWRKK